VWEFSTQLLGNQECVKILILTFGFHQCYPHLPSTVFHRTDLCPVVTFPSKQSSLHAIQKCRCFMFILHLSWACPRLFSQFPALQTDRHQSRSSDGSNLNSGCNVFIFLQHKYRNYTWSMQQYLCNFLSRKIVCGRIVESVNRHCYNHRVLIQKSALKTLLLI